MDGQRLGHGLRKARLDDLARRDVHRHAHGRAVRVRVPARRLLAGLGEDPAADLEDEARLLGDRDEVVGTDDLSVAVPADERLEADRATRGQLHQRLVVDLELVAVDRLPQRALEREPLIAPSRSAGRRRARSRRRRGASPGSGRRRRRAGRRRDRPRSSRTRCPRWRSRQPPAVTRLRLPQVRHEPLGHPQHVGLVAHVLADDHELVAGEAADRVARPDGLVEPARRRADHLVAGDLAERVVHELHAVEIDEEDAGGAVLTAAGGKRVRELLHQQGAVRESGQLIVESAALQLDLVGAAVGDVDGGYDPAADLAVLVAQRRAVVDDPALAAPGANHAALDGGLLTLTAALDGGLPGAAVGGVESGQRAPSRSPARGRSRGCPPSAGSRSGTPPRRRGGRCRPATRWRAPETAPRCHAGRAPCSVRRGRRGGAVAAARTGAA